MHQRSEGRTAWLWSLCLAGAASACARDDAASDLRNDASVASDASDAAPNGEVVTADALDAADAQATDMASAEAHETAPSDL